MNALEKIVNEIIRDEANGRFVGSWHIEGCESEKAKLCESLQALYGRKPLLLSCVRLKRYPAHVDTLKLGTPYRENSRLFLLRIDIGESSSPSFGALPKTKKPIEV